MMRHISSVLRMWWAFLYSQPNDAIMSSFFFKYVIYIYTQFVYIYIYIQSGVFVGRVTYFGEGIQHQRGACVRNMPFSTFQCLYSLPSLFDGNKSFGLKSLGGEQKVRYVLKVVWRVSMIRIVGRLSDGVRALALMFFLNPCPLLFGHLPTLFQNITQLS